MSNSNKFMAFNLLLPARFIRVYLIGGNSYIQNFTSKRGLGNVVLDFPASTTKSLKVELEGEWSSVHIYNTDGTSQIMHKK